jgi:acetoin utilization protein AcuB
MLVGNRMSRPVISLSPELPIMDALSLMRRERIRRAPVIQDGRMVGVVSMTDLLNASPSSATSLSVWELNYLMSKIAVKEVMTKKVLTVNEETPIEEAARIMADNKIGGLPVVRGDEVVGIITETDIFKVFLELLGARESGVRVTAEISDERGTLAKITQAISAAGGSFVAFGQFSGESASSRTVTFKVRRLDAEQVRAAIDPLIIRCIDIQTKN